jgi:large-conductance mechanosensitive channel
MFIPMHNPNAVPVASLETTTDMDAAASNIGLFINAVVEFIIVAFVSFLVRASMRLGIERPRLCPHNQQH